MKTIRAALSSIWTALGPTPGTTEGAVDLGLVLVAAGFIAAGLPALALIVPGTALVAIGVLPALPRRR